MFIRIIYLMLLFITSNSNAVAKFEGKLVLLPDGCEAIRSCILKEKLRYTDPNGFVWEAKAGIKTDGASIPWWAQKYIGEPYDISYLKAAVIHDHYCDKHVRAWQQTHRVFFDALLELGVPEKKSKIMYFAVLLGGPKWISLVPGNDCGDFCINKIETFRLSSEGLLKIKQESYDNLDMNYELNEFEKYIDENNGEISPEEIEEYVYKKNPDALFNNEGEVRVGPFNLPLM